MRSALLPWAAAALAMAALYALFAPGHYSFDAAHLWWMVRNDDFDSTHPVALGLVWQASRAVLPDPHGFFALQLAMVGAGLALTASALPLSRPMQAVVVLAVAAWPAFGALLPQVWKDVWMTGALLVAVGALLHDARAPHGGWRALALLALAFATALRFNAITGVLPLLAWLLVAQWRARRAARPGRRARRSAALGATLTLAAFAGLAALPGLLVTPRPVPAWPFVALWDLAAVEIATGRAQIPAALRAPAGTREALAAAFRPDNNVSTVGSGLTLYSREQPLDADRRRALLQAWLTLPLREPSAYAAHRWRLAQHLFGADGVARDPGLALMPGVVPLLDNPPLAPSTHPWAGRLQSAWRDALATPAFEGRWYALAALLALLAACLRRRGPAAAVAASGIGMALPLLLVAPSAEFRYLLWLVVAAPLALLLLRTAPAAAR